MNESIDRGRTTTTATTMTRTKQQESLFLFSVAAAAITAAVVGALTAFSSGFFVEKAENKTNDGGKRDDTMDHCASGDSCSARENKQDCQEASIVTGETVTVVSETETGVVAAAPIPPPPQSPKHSSRPKSMATPPRTPKGQKWRDRLSAKKNSKLKQQQQRQEQREEEDTQVE